MNVVDDALLSAARKPRQCPASCACSLATCRCTCARCAMSSAQLLADPRVVLPRHRMTRTARPPTSPSSTRCCAPALECLRRDLMSQATIEELNRTVGGLDKDLKLLLTQGAAEAAPRTRDGANELQQLLQQTIEHLRCGHRRTAGAGEERRAGALAASAARRRHAVPHARPPAAPGAWRRCAARAGDHQRNSVRRSPRMPSATACCAARCARAPGARSACWRCCASVGRGASSQRDAHIGEILARKADRGHREQLRCLERPVHAHRFRAARARAWSPSASAASAWSALYIDVDQLHAINEKFGMHVGDAVLGAARRARARAPAAAGPSARASPATASRCCCRPQLDDAERFAESLREGAEQLGTLHGDSRLHVSISVGVALLERAARRAHARRSPPPRPPARRPRIAAATASRSTSRTMRASCGASPTSTSPSQLREAIDAGRLHSRCAAHPAVRRRRERAPALRAAAAHDRRGRPDHRARPLPVRRATATSSCRRSTAGWCNHVIDALKPHAELLAGAARSGSRSTSPASRSTTTAFGDFLLERIAGSGLDPELFCFEITENATVASISRAPRR